MRCTFKRFLKKQQKQLREIFLQTLSAYELAKIFTKLGRFYDISKIFMKDCVKFLHYLLEVQVWSTVTGHNLHDTDSGSLIA